MGTPAMRLRSPKFLLVTVFALIALALNLSVPMASADGPSDKSSSQSRSESSDHSQDSDHSEDQGSEECEDDGDDSSSHSSSASIKKSSSKKISAPKNESSRKEKNDDDSRNDQEDDDSDSEENCGSGGNGGGDSPAEILKRVPKTIGTPTIATCTTDASLTWATVVSPGYAVVDSYRVQYSSNGGTTWTTYPTQTAANSLTLTGLPTAVALIFQVAAHNANGWGAWSASTAGCTLTAATGTTFGYTLDGLSNVPLLAPTDTYPTIAVDYQGVLTVVSRPVIATAGDSGDFLKGTFTHDLYVSLPIRAGGYTFTVTGGPAPVSLGNATSITGAGLPTTFANPANDYFYSLFQVYAFTISSGSTLAIVVNP